MSFSELGLEPELIEAVVAKGYQTPSPIQAKAIPAILDGHDVLGGAQTGTGKTAAFSLPLLQRLSASHFKMKRPRALILTPTRELAAQVHQSIVDYGRSLELRSAVVFGGVGFQPQVSALRRGLDIIVATPGRLLDLCERGDANLSAIDVLVLDEADRMLDMGFIHDIKKILKLLPDKRQNLFFSATYSKEVKRLADSILRNPIEVEVAPRNSTADRVYQEAYRVGQKSKQSLLAKMIDEENWSQALVFTRTKHGANRLAKQLDKKGIEAVAIHGNKSQNARQRALKDFKDYRIRVLVATDIAARGLDIDSLPFVVNFELPNVPEDYVHRIGRTGRAGKEGKAVSFVGEGEDAYLRDIERLLKKEIPLYYFNNRDERVEVDRSKYKNRKSPPAKKRAHASRDESGNQRSHKKRRPRKRRSGGGGANSRSEGASDLSSSIPTFPNTSKKRVVRAVPTSGGNAPTSGRRRRNR